MRIIVIEDNQKLAGYMQQMLAEEGYAVDVFSDGETGERMIRGGSYDLVVLDIMLPGKDGMSVCADLRTDNINLPIIMITAKGEVDDRILGLDSGADDYLVKPFDMKELSARVRALLRRPQETFVGVLRVGKLELNPTTHVCTCDNVEISLTLKEYAILEYLMRHAGKVVTREQLLEHCWDFAYTAFSNITDVYIKQLRKKLGPHHENIILTVRGVGYTLTA